MQYYCVGDSREKLGESLDPVCSHDGWRKATHSAFSKLALEKLLDAVR
jgi:hypothetical protein